ncbi:MAG: MFS transporter [Thermodesulfobacteriota bacterium]
MVFTLVAAGVFFATMDSSMVNIGLPAIMAEFASPLAQTQWVVLIYLLTTSTTMLFWGHLGDGLGRGRVYSGGLLFFAVGSLCCSQAATLALLLLGRFIQAFGAAMMMANGPALLKEAFPPQQLGRSLGYITIATSLGLMSGPVLAGLVLHFSSWRLMFLAPLPLYLLITVIAFFLLAREHGPGRWHNFDWLGGLWWSFLLAGTTYTLTHAASPVSSRPVLLLSSFMVLLSLLFFILQERRLAARADDDGSGGAGEVAPIIPAPLLRQRALVIAVLTACLSFLCLFAVLILTPFYLDRVLGLEGGPIGLVMLAIPVMVLLTGPVAGWLADCGDTRVVASLGLAICCLGIFLFSRLTVTSSPWQVALVLGCFGLGQALFLSPNSTSALRRTAHTGVVSALLATARTVGMMLGIALASLLFSRFFAHFSGGMELRDYTSAQAGAFVAALAWSYRCFLLVGLAALFLSLLRPPGHRFGQKGCREEEGRRGPLA